jgi:hypothetical protein
VFASGDLHPEYDLTFETPEFSTSAMGYGRFVKAIWGTGIKPIGWSNQDGSGAYFARIDHVHQHPVFASGDLHPEYLIDEQVPGRDNYDVLWSDGTDTLKWSNSPTLLSMQLGGQTVGTGTLWLGSPSGTSRIGLRGYRNGGDMVLNLPTGVPVPGQFLGVASYDSGNLIASLDWLGPGTGGYTGSQSIVTSVTCNNGTLSVINKTFTWVSGLLTGVV